MKKRARGDGDTRKEAEQPFQGIGLDWAFIVQSSKNTVSPNGKIITKTSSSK